MAPKVQKWIGGGLIATAVTFHAIEGRRQRHAQEHEEEMTVEQQSLTAALNRLAVATLNVDLPASNHEGRQFLEENIQLITTRKLHHLSQQQSRSKGVSTALRWCRTLLLCGLGCSLFLI